jgi:hypothetical protein
VEHLLCQLSFGYLPHEKITASMQRFAGDVMPRFRKDFVTEASRPGRAV